MKTNYEKKKNIWGKTMKNPAAVILQWLRCSDPVLSKGPAMAHLPAFAAVNWGCPGDVLGSSGMRLAGTPAVGDLGEYLNFKIIGYHYVHGNKPCNPVFWRLTNIHQEQGVHYSKDYLLGIALSITIPWT